MLRPLAITAATIASLTVSVAMGQPDDAIRSQSPTVDSGNLGDAALVALGDGEIETALELLGAAVDANGVNTVDASMAHAAGGLHRMLAQLDADERYDLLHAWTMPAETRPTVRLLNAIVPHVRPPGEFARLLGERPRDSSFSVARIHDVEGLFSSGWELVQSADEVGKLARLTAELEACAAESMPNAEALLMLSRIADPRSDVSALNIAAIQPGPPSGSRIDLSQLVVAVAGLSREELRASSLEQLDAMVSIAESQPIERPGDSDGQAGALAFLRLAHATAVRLHSGDSETAMLQRNRLKYWVPGAGGGMELETAGPPAARWLTHENHILHLAGAGNDALFCRFPLTGEFEFSCDTQIGGRPRTNGGLSYGGLHYAPSGESRSLAVLDADLQALANRPCPYLSFSGEPEFNRLSLRSSAGGAQFCVNLHPMWSDDAELSASPWLGLRSLGDCRPLFRNLELTGTPVVPREVTLLTEGNLRGWHSFTIGKSPADHPGWTLDAGQLRSETLAGEHVAQNLLRYERPLLDGESVTYEFFYQPGAVEVHPALGRVAFLIEPEGVRIHWITARERDWTGLAADNAAIEPLNRRGPRQLPLHLDEWNTVSLRRSGDTVSLSLNSEEIYTRPFDYGGDPGIGFYHDPNLAGVQVRNVTLTGDWPTMLPEDFLQNPAALSE